MKRFAPRLLLTAALAALLVLPASARPGPGHFRGPAPMHGPMRPGPRPFGPPPPHHHHHHHHGASLAGGLFGAAVGIFAGAALASAAEPVRTTTVVQQPVYVTQPVAVQPTTTVVPATVIHPTTTIVAQPVTTTTIVQPAYRTISVGPAPAVVVGY